MTLDTVKAKRLWTFLKPYWHLELVTFLVMAVLAGLTLALPGAVRYLIDVLIPRLVARSGDGGGVGSVIYFGLFLLGIYLGQVIFSWLRDYLASYIGANIIANMRSALFEHLEMQSLTFYQTRQVGEIMSRFLSDIHRIQSLLTATLLMFLTNLLLLIAIFIYLLSIDWVLTLVAVIPVPVTMFVTGRFGIRLHGINRLLQETIARLSAKIQEGFLSIKTIKAFGREQYERNQVETVLGELTGLYVKNSIVSSLSMNLVHLLNMIGPIIVLSWGAYLIGTGAMKLGALIAFYMLLTYLYSPIQGLASVHIEVKSAMASVDRIFEYFDIPPAVAEDSNPVTPTAIRGEIALTDIHFSYGQGGFCLENLNLSIAAREKVAIVGPSGSGKTTLINLIMRFYDPEAGSVMLDGIDLRKLTLKSLRDAMSLVDQEPLLFRASIFDNIAYSRPEADQEDIINAARIANIDDFVSSLPDGYDSMVGERGVTISGGEKQRLCLARAVLKDPAVLILDEATSALDSTSERLIQESLRNILADKTAIIIAHRLSTVQHADRIIAIDNGCIIDEGTHDELLEKSPLYRELASKQLKI
ncbi:MAG: ABC transporter ATP-binding protein [Candidatus Zixiibacteriota bacterium]|nr:MAG: ABC transporter ATP-binding protein [candidate division Zixibacteria bacterium]